FDDKATRAERQETDKLAAIRTLFDYLVDKCGQLFTPSEYLTIDEQLNLSKENGWMTHTFRGISENGCIPTLMKKRSWSHLRPQCQKPKKDVTSAIGQKTQQA
ncbi:hypothetical protein CBL_20785, partial [Carabus blaptoides fortunei]